MVVVPVAVVVPVCWVGVTYPTFRSPTAGAAAGAGVGGVVWCVV